MTTKPRLAMAAAATVGLSLLTALPAFSHGYIQNPPSRSYLCSTGAVTNCGPIQWEPQSVEGPKGFPQAGPADGEDLRRRRLPLGASRRPARRHRVADHHGDGRPAVQLHLDAHRGARHHLVPLLHHPRRLGPDPTADQERAGSVPFLQVNYGGGHPPNPGRPQRHDPGRQVEATTSSSVSGTSPTPATPSTPARTSPSSPPLDLPGRSPCRRGPGTGRRSNPGGARGEPPCRCWTVPKCTCSRCTASSSASFSPAMAPPPSSACWATGRFRPEPGRAGGPRSSSSSADCS